MGLRTASQFLAGLHDSREVYYRGHRVADVPSHPELGVVARHVAIDFELAENPMYSDIARFHEDGEVFSAYYKSPKGADDLTRVSRLIEAGGGEGACLVMLMKERGAGGLFALSRVVARGGTAESQSRVDVSYRQCRRDDLALAVAQTDVKGDRSKRPSEQDDPDLYVRVVEERSDGLVVRGAKLHTSYAPCVDELIGFPSRSMGRQDEAWPLPFPRP